MALLPFETSMLTLEFNSTFEMLLQQEVSKLRSLVTSKGYKGKEAVAVNQMGALQFKMPAGRYSPKQFQIAQFTRPWVTPVPRSLTVPVDEFDLLNSIADPKGVISQSAVAAANRLYDDTIILAAFGTTLRGETDSGQTSETWPAVYSTTTGVGAPYGGFWIEDTFGSGAATGMTFTKIREMRRIAQHYENNLDAESLCLVAGSQQESDLLAQTQVIDKNFNSGMVVESGRVGSILGTSLVYSERLQYASTIRNCIGFTKSGLHLGVWKELDTRIDQRKDLESDPWQLYSMIQIGACRTQLGKVFEVDCYDATTTDITP